MNCKKRTRGALKQNRDGGLILYRKMILLTIIPVTLWTACIYWVLRFIVWKATAFCNQTTKNERSGNVNLNCITHISPTKPNKFLPKAGAVDNGETEVGHLEAMLRNAVSFSTGPSQILTLSNAKSRYLSVEICSTFNMLEVLIRHEFVLCSLLFRQKLLMVKRKVESNIRFLFTLKTAMKRFIVM